MLVDFEKAFNSVLWEFMYSAFKFVDFQKKILWLKLFNNNTLASVIQCGIFSTSFEIKRGCKQGDQLARLDFIVSREILSILNKKNIHIKGLQYDSTPFTFSFSYHFSFQHAISVGRFISPFP